MNKVISSELFDTCVPQGSVVGPLLSVTIKRYKCTPHCEFTYFFCWWYFYKVVRHRARTIRSFISHLHCELIHYEKNSCPTKLFWPSPNWVHRPRTYLSVRSTNFHSYILCSSFIVVLLVSSSNDYRAEYKLYWINEWLFRVDWQPIIFPMLSYSKRQKLHSWKMTSSKIIIKKFKQNNK